jgi:aminopeptidase-like protein
LFELPLCGFSRSKDYPEYHTNKDDFKVVTQKGLQDSFIVMKSIIDAFELGLYPQTKVFCEPNLGKRNLYPLISKKEWYKDEEIKIRTNLISYANGKNNIFNISNLINVPLSKICKEYSLLKSKKVLK